LLLPAFGRQPSGTVAAIGPVAAAAGAVAPGAWPTSGCVLGIGWPGWIGGALGSGLALAARSDFASARNLSRLPSTTAAGPVNLNDVTLSPSA